MDRRYLTTIAMNYGGGPVGVETMAAALSEPRDAIEDIIEPFLIQCGYLQRTPRGRLLTTTPSAISASPSRRAIRRSSGCSGARRGVAMEMAPDLLYRDASQSGRRIERRSRRCREGLPRSGLCSGAGKGSHAMRKHPAATEILTIPAGRPIKPVYIRNLVHYIETHGGPR